MTRRELRRATAAYCGMIEALDADFATLAARIDFVGGNLDDWWIVYTSDHGEMLGQHGVWEKQKFFEGSVRVPLVVRPPKHLAAAWGCAGKRSDANVSLLDLFATFCDAGGVPEPAAEDTVNGAGLDSRSLVPLLRGDADAAGRFTEATSEFDGENLLIQRGPLKYQWYGKKCSADPAHREVLFDLDAEPDERRNLIDRPRYADALASFRERRVELGF